MLHDLLRQRVVRFEHRAVPHLDSGEQCWISADVFDDRHLAVKEEERMVERRKTRPRTRRYAAASDCVAGQPMDVAMDRAR